jgi:HlyD family secretion protein
MEVQAEIKVGTRSVLEYIIHPLVKSLDEAIREP